MSKEECLAVVANLPESMGRLILSGGEPLAERTILYDILDALQERYQGAVPVMLQTNGDLLTAEILDVLLTKGVVRFDIASIDRYHKHMGSRLGSIRTLFSGRGVVEQPDPLITKEGYQGSQQPTWGYWGATEEMWLGGNWPRGRALQTEVWTKNPNHNFCSVLSGGIGFFTGAENIPQEISIQLWKINPCCPGTAKPLGDARTELVSSVLERSFGAPHLMALNNGQPNMMGMHLGVSVEQAQARIAELGSVCLWCDEFFEKYT
jgi:hypothetical protein